VWGGRAEGESEGRSDGIPKSKLSGSQVVNQRLWNQKTPIEWNNCSSENLEFHLAIYLPVKQSLFKRRLCCCLEWKGSSWLEESLGSKATVAPFISSSVQDLLPMLPFDGKNDVCLVPHD
jgi:hypothetical protein